MTVEEKYKKLKILGKGATSQVYLVEEISTGKRYAMKVCENTELLSWEAELLECVAQMCPFPAFVEYSEEEKSLVMECVEGRNLQEILDQGEHLEIGEAVYIMDGVLKALNMLHMHKPAIIYRDLKPANIMLCRDGSVCLIDLGAACYEEAQGQGEKRIARAGTYGYAAPEQFWEGIIPDRTCDIYSAGKVFSYLLTGKNPAEPPYDVENYCRGLGKVAPCFMEVLERSLAVAPQARYEDAESMRRAICRAYEASQEKVKYRIRQKSTRIYEKCIWKSEYRRIF